VVKEVENLGGAKGILKTGLRKKKKKTNNRQSKTLKIVGT